jgi:hypothetical protein
VAATTVTPPAAGGGVIPAPAGALPISVADDGATLTTAVRSFNFVGDGVVAVANTQTNLVTVTITGGNVIGNYSNANVAAYLPTNTSNVRGNYFIGNGSLLTGIAASGSSNIIVNGTSNVTIPTANGNVTINAGDSKQWTFGTDGILTLANGATLKEGVTLGALALGYQAGATSQGIRAVAIGQSAGQTSQGSRAVAVGLQAGTSSQGGFAVAVGASAGQTSQGGYAVAIGASAGVTSQGNNSIIINASGSTLDQTRANTFTVAPVRNDTSNTANVMFYNATSNEITYGNTISVAGNITANYILGNGSQLTGLGATYSNSNVASYLGSGTNTSNIITTGNVSGGYILGNGSQLTGLGATYANANVAAYLPTYTGNLVSLTGNVTTTANITGGNIITATVVNSGNIVIEAGNNIDLRGGDKVSAPGQAGGSINIDAGDGGADNGTIAGAGGFVEISGGPGGTVAAGTSGTGGYVAVSGGMGSGANVTNARTAGVGGAIQIAGGDGGMANTSPLSSAGGNVEITGGTGSRSQANAVTGAAGHVNIYGGNWGSTANSGNITVNTYRPTTQYQWSFDNAGNLTLPDSSKAIGVLTSSFTGTIAGTTLTVTGATAGTIAWEQSIEGTGVAPDTFIVTQLTGTSGGNGTYSVTVSQNVGPVAMNVAAMYLNAGLKLGVNHAIYQQDEDDATLYNFVIGIEAQEATIHIGDINTNGVCIPNNKEYKGHSALNPGTFMAVAKVDTADQVILSSGNGANTLIRVGGDSTIGGYGLKLNNGGQGLMPIGLRIGDNTNSGIFGAALEVGSILGAAANNQSSPAGASFTSYRGTGTVIANDEWGSYLYGARFRGTINSPLAVKNNDWLMEFGAIAFDGTNNNGGGEMAFRVDGTVTSSANPSRWELYVTPAGTNSQTLGLKVDSNLTVTAYGNITTSGNITGGNIILTNGAVIKNTAGNALAIGYLAGNSSQGSYATAIGFGAGGTSQGTDAIAIGGSAGSTSQGTYGVSIGYLAGQTTQGTLAVALGRQAGYFVQGIQTVAVGYLAGNATQANYSVAVGASAGSATQGEQAVAVGYAAGGTAQGNYAVAVGKFSANSNQGIYAVAIGPNAGQDNQLANAVAIGSSAGASSQGINSVAIGGSAALNGQGNNAVAVGNSAAYLVQGANSVAVGVNAGLFYLGNSSIAIGANAGNNQQGNNSIIFNATGSNLRNTTANTFTVAPVRNDVANTANVMFYNATSNEITYGNTISVAGNISGGNLNVTGNIVDTGELSIITGSNGNIALTPNGTGNVTVSSNISISGNTATITSANYQIGYLTIPQVSLSANATTALTDSGKHFYSVSASNLQLTIANNTSVTWPVGTAMTIVNRGTANVLIVPGTGVSLFLAGNSTSANRVVTTYGMATVINVAANIWMINGTVV